MVKSKLIYFDIKKIILYLLFLFLVFIAYILLKVFFTNIFFNLSLK